MKTQNIAIEESSTVADLLTIRHFDQSTSLESRTLAELRDTLLPKLLSGELGVPAATGKLAEVRA